MKNIIVSGVTLERERERERERGRREERGERRESERGGREREEVIRTEHHLHYQSMAIHLSCLGKSSLNTQLVYFSSTPKDTH